MSDEKQPQPLTSSVIDNDKPIVQRHLYVEEVCGMWNLIKVFRRLGTREQAITFAEERGMISAKKLCHYHKKPMNIEYTTNKTVGSFVCNKGPCRAKSKFSRGKGTWFENTKMTLPQIFYLMYAYASKWTYNQTIKEDFCKGEHRLSRATINNWFNYCREAIAIYQVDKQIFTGKIGGPGKIVHLDKSKFGKRKFNKGHHIEGHWVLRMIEENSEDLRLEVCPDNVISAEVLVPLIKKHVVEGTIIHTNFWHICDCLQDHGFIHCKVKYSELKDSFEPGDSMHTIQTKKKMPVIKKFFYKLNNPKCFSDLLYEYLWRLSVMKLKKDPFEELIKVVNHVYNK